MPTAETLAFVTMIITQGAEGLPVGLTMETNHPVQCIAASEAITERVEQLGAKVDLFCEYTQAPARSLRPKARGEN